MDRAGDVALFVIEAGFSNTEDKPMTAFIGVQIVAHDRQEVRFCLGGGFCRETARSCARHERAMAKEASSTANVSAADINISEVAVLYPADQHALL